MGRPALSESNKYYVPKNLYRQCLYFCRQYPEWVIELSTDESANRGVSYEKDRVQTSEIGDSTSVIAMRRHIIEKKKKMVDDALEETVPAMLIPWVRLGVTTDISGWVLEEKGMPCSHNTYFKYRRKFFWNLSQKI